MLIPCLIGPTGAGKTALALELASFCNIEIISVDSMLIYRQMDIGTAKPSKQEQAIAVHHLIDICEFYEPHSVMNFVIDAEKAIQNCLARNKIPLLVGGTMLYFKALIEGLSDLPASDLEIRKKMQNKLENQGVLALYEELQQCDPATASKLKATDSQRICRALEIYYITGKAMSEQLNQPKKPKFQFLQFALNITDRAKLHQIIANRLEQMWKQGLLDEAKQIYEHKNFDRNLPALRAVGYKQLWDLFDNKINQTEALEKSIFATRQLAKRQITWLNNWKHPLNFLELENRQNNLQILKNALNSL